MVLKRLRGFTITVSVLALASNGLSACLFHKLSDGAYRSFDGLSLYTYFAAFISFFGVFGSVKQHAYTLSIFANFFILDTIVSAFSRFVILYIFSTFRYHICDVGSTNAGLLALTLPHGTFHTSTFSHIDDVIEATGVEDNDVNLSGTPYQMPHALAADWGCIELMQISVVVGWIGLFTSMLVQMFFAVLVRQHAMSLWRTRVDYVRSDNGVLEKGYMGDEPGRSQQPRGASVLSYQPRTFQNVCQDDLPIR